MRPICSLVVVATVTFSGVAYAGNISSQSVQEQTDASAVASDRPAYSVQVGPLEILASQDGLIIERQRWRFSNATGVAWRARTALPGRIRVVGADAVSPFDDLLPRDVGPWVAINGGFYDENGQPMGLVVSDGITQSAFRRGGGSGIFQVVEGEPRVIHHSEYETGSTQALQSIDRIIGDGRVLVNQRPEARAAARAAIAISETELFFIVLAQDEGVVGGRDDVRIRVPSGIGMPLWAFTEYVALTTDAREALNLDGALSAQIAARVEGRNIRVRGVGGTINAVIMRPSK